MKLAIVTIIVLFLNIPFGYWRANVRKFSVQWFVAIHLPVPFVAFLRLYSEIGFALYTYFFLVGAFFVGQRLGWYIYRRFKKNGRPVSSLIFKDLFRSSGK